MKLEKILLMSLMAVFLIGIVNASGATVTVTLTPAASSLVKDASGIYNFSVSVGGTDIANITYLWVEAYSVSTVNTSTTANLICFRSAVNDVNNTDHIDCQVSSETLLQDALDYVIIGRVQNGTGATGENFTADTNTGIIVDNTVPKCIDNSGFSRGDIVSPTATWSITGENATGGKIVFNGNSYDLSKGEFTGRNLALTFSSRVPESIYTVTSTVTDGTNSTTCTILEYIELEDSEKAKRGVAVTYPEVPTGKDIGIIIIALIILMVMDKKKKKR